METKQPIGETHENFHLAESVEKAIIFILDTCEEMLLIEIGRTGADELREVIKIISAAELPSHRSSGSSRMRTSQELKCR